MIISDDLLLWFIFSGLVGAAINLSIDLFIYDDLWREKEALSHHLDMLDKYQTVFRLIISILLILLGPLSFWCCYRIAVKSWQLYNQTR